MFFSLLAKPYNSDMLYIQINKARKGRGGLSMTTTGKHTSAYCYDDEMIAAVEAICIPIIFKQASFSKKFFSFLTCKDRAGQFFTEHDQVPLSGGGRKVTCIHAGSACCHFFFSMTEEAPKKVQSV